MGFSTDRAKQFFDVERGAKELMTYFRQGLKEVRSMLFSESPHARETDPGMWGNKLPMEVYEDRHGGDGLEVVKPEPPQADESLRKLEQQFEPVNSSRDEHQLEEVALERD